jgi:hypothetical protein
MRRLTNVEGQRVDAGDQIGAESCMDGAMALDAAHGRKGGSAQNDVEMGFASAIIARVACVAVAIVDHLDVAWRKDLGKFALYLVCDCHISVKPLQSVE